MSVPQTGISIGTRNRQSHKNGNCINRRLWRWK